ncbi:hypothetical protein RchiOBHm_Chr2g0172071 [Rosa chinensis]|uniref:Uncharacterized protein n=1 Tax=Rosa chinensis TaxID=74649 RepID=A0A2P6S5I2_ROSCH|nr:hypothetical protein RchiOBHm_Chr2g0172071 [Rosa chinensis]
MQMYSLFSVSCYVHSLTINIRETSVALLVLQLAYVKDVATVLHWKL